MKNQKIQFEHEGYTFDITIDFFACVAGDSKCTTSDWDYYGGVELDYTIHSITGMTYDLDGNQDGIKTIEWQTMENDKFLNHLYNEYGIELYGMDKFDQELEAYLKD